MTERRKKVMSVFSVRLKEFRKAKNLSQKALADLLKISPSRISNWEHGKGCLSAMHLYVLCKIFKVTSAFFLGDLVN